MLKKIVYLLGSGASHAVVNNSDPTKGLMTTDIQDKIKDQYETKNPLDSKVWNELVTDNFDVEQLIAYLEFKYDYGASNLVRKYYREALINLSKKYSRTPPKNNLYSVLLDLHFNDGILLKDEKLQCFMTLNYEDILERTIIKHHKRDIDYNLNDTKKPTDVKVYKLHGSFNWSNERPILIEERMTDVPSKKALWIPPGIDKKKENYPFNLLWGDAMEELMINCDVLRVIGCSLSRNDWGLIPILYDIQTFNAAGRNFEIEIIDFKKTALKIKQNYSYLRIKGINEINLVIDYMKSTYSTDTDEIESYLNSYTYNPMKLWLEAKIDGLYNNPANPSYIPKKGIAYHFFNKL